MEYRTLDLKIISAKDIKDVNLFSKMDVYAVVSLAGDYHQKQKARTPVDKDGGTSPTWNFPITFTVNEFEAQQNRLSLEIKLVSERSLASDKDIGQVHVPVKELLDQPGDGKSFQYVSYQVMKPSGKPQGSLNISYKFGDKISAPATAPAPAMAAVPKGKEEPVMAYPPPGAAGSSSVPYPGAYPPPHGAYPPPQHAAGYGYPQGPQPPYGGYQQPQPGYGYAAQPGYGYPPVQQPQKKKNKFGMGLGAGLLGGALGGLLIGDMVSDAADYDGGYDGGFDDGGGFDF